MRRIWFPLLTTGLVFAAGHASADQVFIKKLIFAGSGCLPSSGLKAKLDDFNKDGLPDRFDVTFSNYIARSGPNTPVINQRRNCNLNVTLGFPKGWQYTITEARYGGLAGLPDGVRGVQQSTYQFPFVSEPATLEATLDGPFRKRFQREDQLASRDRVWSPCALASPLNLRTQVVLLGKVTSPAILRATNQSYGLAWRRCTR